MYLDSIDICFCDLISQVVCSCFRRVQTDSAFLFQSGANAQKQAGKTDQWKSEMHRYSGLCSVV